MSELRRRADDVRMDGIEGRLTALEKKIDENTAITKAVAEVMASLHVLAAVGKWLAAVGAGILALKHLPEWFR